MAGAGVREDGPRQGAVTRFAAASDIPAILTLLALGVALRVIIAYVLLPGSGFPNDLASFRGWGNDIATHGPIGFYDRASFIDYPPVYLILLGALSALTGGYLGEGVKLLPILADAALAAVVWQMAVELGASRRRAFVVAGVILVNPITWINSAIWGQADAVGSIFLLLGLRELMRDRREAASALAVLSVLTKMQLGILGFLVGFVVLRRSLRPRDGEPEPGRILTSIGAGLATGALVCLPFTGLDFVGLGGRLGTPSGLLTIAVGLIAGLGVFALARSFLPPIGGETEATPAESDASAGPDAASGPSRRTVVAALLGAGTAVAFAGMFFDSIATHLLDTFGEYPFLTLNAYNPWALVSDAGRAMDVSLSWIHDSAWVDVQGGGSGPGFLFANFPGAVSFMALAASAVLLLVAVLAWLRAGAMTAARSEEVAADPGAERAGTDRHTPSGLAAFFEGHDWPSELRGLAAVLVVAAAVIAFVVGGQLVAPLPAAVVGDVLLVAVLVGASAWAAWRDDRLSLLVALTILSVAFFVVPTRVHERYLFPFFGLGALLLALSWRWSVLYVALAVVNSANLLAVLVEYQGVPSTDGWPAGTLIDWGTGVMNARIEGVIWPIALSAVVTGLAMIWVLLQMRGVAASRLAREALAAAGDLDREHPNEPAPLPTLPVTTAAARLAPTLAIAAAAEPGPLPDEPAFEAGMEDSGDAWSDEMPRPALVPGAVMLLWRRLARPSLMPDRSAALSDEPRGRIDKLDLWVVAALVIAVLSLRIYRLDEPPQMYFDEVYHARTATEFLQDWRYGTPHDIYEWTHPHLAKYAIAAGITLFSDDRVTATGQLNEAVLDAVVQPRSATSPRGGVGAGGASAGSDARYGDRALVATGSAVKVYDLETRTLVQTFPIPGASALSDVGASGIVYVGTTNGRIWRLDTNTLDDVRLGLASGASPPTELTAESGLSIVRVYAGTPPFLLVADAAGNVASIDLTAAGGQLVARAQIPGAADFADLGAAGPSVSADPAKVANAAAEAALLASDVGGDASSIEQALLASSSGFEVPLPLGSLSSDNVSTINVQVAAGQLPGITLNQSNPQAIVAYSKGLGLLDARHLVLKLAIPTDQPATSIALNPNGDQSSYVAAGSSLVLVRTDVSGSTGTITKDGSQPLKTMPGPVYKVAYDSATKIVQVLGRTADGSGWTVYSIETNGNAVFSDAVLPFQPVALGLDSSPTLPDTNREQLLAFSADGSLATVDVGQFAFSWRIMGVFFGALMAACLYLLARLLFRRRGVGLLVALFTVVDGMFFAQSRIAMNDTYVGGFLLLGYLLFALLWLRVWKGRFAFWLGMPLLGVVMGLALASKWVAVYAIASMGLLVLIRSALGRLITVVGLAAGTGVLGWMAIGEMTTAPNTGNPAAVLLLILVGVGVVLAGAVWALSARTTPDRIVIAVGTAVLAGAAFAGALAASPESIQNGAPNYTFFIIMLAVTTLAAAANVLHPIAWSREEFRFAVVAPVVVGVLLIVLGPPLAGALGLGLSGGQALRYGAAAIAAGPAAALGFWLGGRYGFGPLARPRPADDPLSLAGPPGPAPTGWLRLGSGHGLPAVWMSICLLLVPLAVYVAMYIPWAMPWQAQTATSGNLPVLWCFGTDAQTGQCQQAFPAGHTGQTLWDLTIGMYNYHNDLRASHAASSPWWAWPMDLKPVWFESIGYANDQGSLIYDGGNPAVWWLAIPAMAFIVWQAFRRRSLGLALVVVAFLWQWLSWSRIDRAAFQYHFYTALPFFLLGLAYFLAELWHGPSRRTWLLARIAAAAALLFSAAVWALKSPLCGLARVSTSDYWGNTICGTAVSPDIRIETRMFLIGVVLVAALVSLGVLLIRLERRQARGMEDRLWPLQLLVPVGIAGALLWWIGQSGPRDILFDAAVPSQAIILVLLPVFAILAAVVILARDPRRFVLGACAFAVVTFAALYPNLSALPMPNNIIGVYNGLLPTWIYGFQFSVNLQVSTPVQVLGTDSLICAALAGMLAIIAGWAALERRRTTGLARLRTGYGAAGLDGGPAGGPDGDEAGAGVPGD